MKRLTVVLLAVVLLLPLLHLPTTARAQDQITYNSQPDEVAIFLNNIAFARDRVTLPGDSSLRVLLPPQVFPDTLILRENGQRVQRYRLRAEEGRTAIYWDSGTDGEVREVTLEYLVSGIGWRPSYDMWLGEDPPSVNQTEVGFDFYAEVSNGGLALDEAVTRLVAGRVDTSNVVQSVQDISTNQAVAGFEAAEAEAPASGGGGQVGSVTIQHVYDAGTMTSEPGDVLYIQLLETRLEARILNFWNAPAANQADIIYKVRNSSELPLAPGVVRSYQGGLFVGSDGIELTPIGSEGSVTVGQRNDLRVHRAETRSIIPEVSDDDEPDVKHEVTLTLENFTDGPITVELVDRYPADAQDFTFSMEPQRQAGNLLRWEVTLEQGELLEITYTFIAFN